MTGRHTAGPAGDDARRLAGILGLGYQRPASPRLTVSQLHAMTLGRELDTLNSVRALRARTSPHQAWSPAGQAAWLMGTARLDARRRALRALLRDALLAAAPVHVDGGPLPGGELLCCGIWTEYPTPGRDTQCPACRSVFHVDPS